MDFQNNFKKYLNSKNQTENDDLTAKEMQDLEEAINRSRDTAKNEEERREYDRQATELQKHFYKSNTNSEEILDDSAKQKAFTPKRWSKQPKSPVDITKVKNDISSSQKEFQITFHDLLEASGKQLDIVYHNPVFDLPLTINPDYQKYSMKQRAKLLYHYFTKMDVLKSRLAKQSFHRAPYPKPVLSSNKCKVSLLRNGTDEAGSMDDFVDQLPVKDLYVSRAGRQVKRKIYTEEMEGDSDPDFAFSNKKNKADDSDTKITLDTPFVPEENDSEDKSAPKVPKTRKDTPRRPPPLGLKKYASRSEVLFDKVLEDAEKKKQQQEEMDTFEKTLPKWDDNEEDKWVLGDSPVKEDPEDANFIRKRVVPPNPLKKTGRPRKTTKQEATDKNDSKAESPPGSPVIKRYTNATKSADTKSKPRVKVQKSKDNATPEETSFPKLEKTACPICNKEFLLSEIVHHASNCGIEDEPIDEAVVTNSTVKKISCHLCDREFFMSTDYEVHVKQCIAAKITDL